MSPEPRPVKLGSPLQPLLNLIAAVTLTLAVSPVYADCGNGAKYIQPLVGNPSWVANFNLSGPLSTGANNVTTKLPGWTAGLGVQTQSAVQTTNDMCVSVPVAVGFTNLGKKADAAAANWINEFGTWTPVAGNTAHFDVTIQEFVDCYTTASPGPDLKAGMPSIDQECQWSNGQPTAGPDGEPLVVVSATPSQSPDGNLGYWKDIGTHQTADFSGPGASGGTSVAEGASATKTLYVPADLMDVSAYLRAHITYSEGDSRLGGGPVSWNKGGAKGCPAGLTLREVKSGRVKRWACDRYEKPKRANRSSWRFVQWADLTGHSTSGSFTDTHDSSWFQLSVNPTSVISVKAVPYAIAYMPPGNSSEARILDTVTEGTRYSISSMNASSNASGDIAATCQSTSNALKMGISFVVDLGGTTGFSNSNCNNTKTINGTTQSSAVNDLATVQNSSTEGFEKADPDYSVGAYEKEAFWYDSFDLAIDQTENVYDDNGTTITRYLPTQEPNWGRMTTLEVAMCAFGETTTAIPDPCKAGYVSTETGLQTIDISRPQAMTLVGLDPFFPYGQSVDPRWQGARFVLLPSVADCGQCTVPAGSPQILQVGATYGLGQENTFETGTYSDVTVTDTNTASNGSSLDLGGQVSFPTKPSLGFGFQAEVGGSTSNTVGTVTQAGTLIRYRASILTSESTGVTFRATVGDTNHDILVTNVVATNLNRNLRSNFCTTSGYPNPISLYPYQDNVYAGLLLRDPCAPTPPLILGPSTPTSSSGRYPMYPLLHGPVRRPRPLILGRSSSRGHHPVLKGPHLTPQRRAFPLMRMQGLFHSANVRAQFADELKKVIAANPHMPAYIRAIQRKPTVRSKPGYLHWLKRKWRAL